MLLALDTSTRLASLALTENGALRAELTWEVGQNHGVELLRRLEWLLQTHGLAIAQLRAVAAAIGPGSFTGVRVAVTVAKTLAFSLKVPLVGVSTLDVIAGTQTAAGLPLCALLDAGRGEWYLGHYQAESAGRLWQRVGDYAVVTLEGLAALMSEPTLLCGEISPAVQQMLSERLGTLAVFAPGLASVRRAGVLAELAERRLAQGKQDDPLTLEPLYLRRPAITMRARPAVQLPPTLAYGPEPR